MKTATLLGLAVVVLLNTGCAQQIVYPGTSAYQKRVATFAIQPDVACRLAGRSSGPSAVIDREYLFSKPYKYARLDLAGIYVDGDSGRAERLESSLSLRGGFLTGMPSEIPAARISCLPHPVP